MKSNKHLMYNDSHKFLKKLFKIDDDCTIHILFFQIFLMLENVQNTY